MSIYDILLHELWTSVLKELKYRDIVRICMVSKEFDNLCHDEKIHEYVKNNGYPRVCGYCNFIDLTDYDAYFKEIVGEEYINYNAYNLKTISNFIYDIDVDLVRGDLVALHYNKTKPDKNYILIFDGIMLIDFESAYVGSCRSNYYLPREFTVITNNIPIDYWFKNNLGFKYLKYAWVDIGTIKNQCIDNIRNGDQQEIMTSFCFNNVCYTLYYYDEELECGYDYILNDFTNKFQNNLLLCDFNEYEVIDNNYTYIFL